MKMKKPKRTLPSVPIDRAWFESKMKAAGHTHASLATKIQCHRTMVTWTLMGRRRIALAEASVWAQELDVSVDEIMQRIGAPDHVARSMKTLPVKGWVDEDGLVHWGSRGLVGVRAAPHPGGRAKMALRIQAAGAFDKALVYLADPVRSTPGAEVINRICLVWKMGSTTDYLRLVKATRHPGLFHLATLRDEETDRDVALAAATPVLGIGLA